MENFSHSNTKDALQKDEQINKVLSWQSIGIEE